MSARWTNEGKQRSQGKIKTQIISVSYPSNIKYQIFRIKVRGKCLPLFTISSKYRIMMIFMKLKGAGNREQWKHAQNTYTCRTRTRAEHEFLLDTYLCQGTPKYEQSII